MFEDEDDVRLNRYLALGNAFVAAALFALCAYVLHVAAAGAAEEIRTSGHNVDTGGLPSVITWLLLFPIALLFSLAAVAFHRRWRARWLLETFPFAWIAVPLILAVAFSLVS